MDQRVENLAQHIGISRLANLTGLDRVGYPVVAAIRPLSRNLSVSFGKGDTVEQARISAVMEAAELHFSEMPPSPPLSAAFKDLPPQSALDPGLLAPDECVRDVDCQRLEWVSGFQLQTNRPLLVPWQTTSMDFTVEARKHGRILQFGATGLAAAFDETSAILHGLCEVIERHCHDQWNSIEDKERLVTLVNQNSIRHSKASALFELIARAELSLLLWDMTGTTGVPCYLAEVLDLASGATTAFAQGAAADLSPDVAICKAIAEALQVRLTYIAGSRDDLDWTDYGNRYEATVDSRRWLLEPCLARREVLSAPHSGISVQQELDDITHRLNQNGMHSVVVIRLAPQQLPLSVVKVLVPQTRDLPDVETFARALTPELAISL